MQCVLIMFRHPCYAPALPCAHHISSQRQALRLYLVIVISCVYSVLPICAWVWDHSSGCCDPKGEYLSPSVTIHCLQFLPEEWSHLWSEFRLARFCADLYRCCDWCVKQADSHVTPRIQHFAAHPPPSIISYILSAHCFVLFPVTWWGEVNTDIEATAELWLLTFGTWATCESQHWLLPTENRGFSDQR